MQGGTGKEGAGDACLCVGAGKLGRRLLVGVSMQRMKEGAGACNEGCSPCEEWAAGVTVTWAICHIPCRLPITFANGKLA